MSCPCGLGSNYEGCCGPFIAGTTQARTAETLMRARYTAFATGAVDFIVDTHDPDKRKELDRSGIEDWSKKSTWKGLEVLEIKDGGVDDSKGTVEFVARYDYEDRDEEHRELAMFRKKGGTWYFHDGRVRKGETHVREAPKVGRNDPCACGSGKKFKKCCLTASA